MKWFSFSLSKKVLLAHLMVLLPILVIFLISYNANKSHIERLVLENLGMLAMEREGEIRLFMEANKRRVQDFATDGFIRDSLEKIHSGAKNGDTLGEYLRKNKHPLDKNISGIMIISVNGRVVASTDPARNGLDVSSSPLFAGAGSVATVAEQIIGTGGTPEIVFSSPVYGRNTGAPIGIIANSFNLRELGRILAEGLDRPLAVKKHAYDGSRSMEVYLVNGDRLMLTQSRFISDSVLKTKVDTAPVKLCLDEKRPTAGYYLDYRGVEVAGASICLQAMNWVLLAEVDKNDALAPVFAIRNYAFIAMGLTVVVLLLLYLFSSNVVIKRINALSTAAKDVADGNYAVLIPVKNNDELGRLSESFNSMAEGIAERNRIKRIMDEAQQRLTAIIDTTPDFVATASPDGRILYMNKAAKRLVGLDDADDISNLRIRDVHPGWAANIVLDKGLPIAAGYGIWQGETAIMARSGELTPTSQVIIAHKDSSGEVVYYSTIARDISERKRAEEAVRKLNVELEGRVAERTAALEAVNRELEAFSYSVAHDLRAPLRIIDGFSAAILEESEKTLENSSLEHLRRVRAASSRMAQLIDDLMGLAQVTRARMDMTNVDLSAIARGIVEELKNSQPERNVAFVIQDNLFARADARLLRIVLDNLIGNAWKFTGAKETAVIQLGSSGEELGKSVYFVKDNGAGFDMRYAGRLFGAFQRLHADAEFAGTGVGLATVERIIRRHNGRVWAEAAVDNGATFYFTL
ncbi:MAG: PAS domain S-box protein [Deltaproteobacteria bacterium]|nr:PAS domain S-box protein [Deltaproteobacteria bacterium]